MNEKKHTAVLSGFVLSVSLIAVSLTVLFLTNYYGRTHMRVLGGICQDIIEKQPDAEPAVLSALKEYRFKAGAGEHESFLQMYGYKQSDFQKTTAAYSWLFALVGFLAGAAMFFSTIFFWRRREAVRVKALTDYLERVNTGGRGELIQGGEDEFSKLQDEIYKTVTMLYQTRDAAVSAKNHFAENLYNIAHQIKTPITSISLSVQMWQDSPSAKYPEQIRLQLSRLASLEESLLLLSRIDAGILPLEKKAVDVFTVLTLAADNLQELFHEADVSVEIPESGEMMIYADLDWTMEAIMNLLKNCMEHTPKGGTVFCSYEQNPLYTKILISDTGRGFEKEDIPRLFERFYRGKNAGAGGVGIGLSLSKAIIESQNGTISAKNLPTRGACFDIRFYSH